MIFNSLFFQILLAALAIAIAVVYVKPSFYNIGDLQFAISKYKEERDNVSSFNAGLKKLADKINNEISKEDQDALFKYMPNKVDEVLVSRDIFNISLMAGVVMNDISVASDKGKNRNVANTTSSDKNASVDQHKTDPVPHTFSANVSGDYEDIKRFLMFLEESNYPLEVRSLNITSNSSAEANNSNNRTQQASTDELSAEVEIVTYSRI